MSEVSFGVECLRESVKRGRRWRRRSGRRIRKGGHVLGENGEDGEKRRVCNRLIFGLDRKTQRAKDMSSGLEELPPLADLA